MNNTSLETYTEKVAKIAKLSDETQKPRQGKGNRTMRKRLVGPQIQKAGMEFLENIHQECKIGATEDELQEEREKLSSFKNDGSKPELTPAYLKSIGYANYASW